MAETYTSATRIFGKREKTKYKSINKANNRNTWLKADAGNKDATVADDKAILNAFSNRWILRCFKSLCRSLRAHSGTAWNTNSPSDYSRLIEATGDANTSCSTQNVSMSYDTMCQIWLV